MGLAFTNCTLNSCVDYSEAVTILANGSPVSIPLKDVQSGMRIMTLDNFTTPVYSLVLHVSKHSEDVSLLEFTIVTPAGSVYKHRLVPYHHLWTFRGSVPVSVPASQIVVGDNLMVFADKQCHLSKVVTKNVVAVKGVASVWTSVGSFLANSVLTLFWCLVKVVREMWAPTVKKLDDVCHAITMGAKKVHTGLCETLKKARAAKDSSDAIKTADSNSALKIQ